MAVLFYLSEELARLL